MNTAPLCTDLGVGLKYSPDRKSVIPDNKTDPTIDPEGLVERAYQEHYEYVAKRDHWIREAKTGTTAPPRVMIEYVLNPMQIDLLLSKVISSDIFDMSNTEMVGYLISDHIRKSYSSGLYNKFTLTTGDVAVNMLCYFINAAPDRRIQLTIDGIAGGYCSMSSSCMDIEVIGKCGTTGFSNMHDSSILLKGYDNDNNFIGDDSKNCRFSVVDLITYSCLAIMQGYDNKIFLINESGEILDQSAEWNKQ